MIYLFILGWIIVGVVFCILTVYVAKAEIDVTHFILFSLTGIVMLGVFLGISIAEIIDKQSFSIFKKTIFDFRDRS